MSTADLMDRGSPAPVENYSNQVPCTFVKCNRRYDAQHVLAGKIGLLFQLESSGFALSAQFAVGEVGSRSLSKNTAILGCLAALAPPRRATEPDGPPKNAPIHFNEGVNCSRKIPVSKASPALTNLPQPSTYA